MEMTGYDLMLFVDLICEKEGYTDSPGYDVLYNMTRDSSAETSELIIKRVLEEYNQ